MKKDALKQRQTELEKKELEMREYLKKFDKFLQVTILRYHGAVWCTRTLGLIGLLCKMALRPVSHCTSLKCIVIEHFISDIVMG